MDSASVVAALHCSKQRVLNGIALSVLMLSVLRVLCSRACGAKASPPLAAHLSRTSHVFDGDIKVLDQLLIASSMPNHSIPYQV